MHPHMLLVLGCATFFCVLSFVLQLFFNTLGSRGQLDGTVGNRKTGMHPHMGLAMRAPLPKTRYHVNDNNVIII